MEYGLLGEVLGHSYSAYIHEYIEGYKYELKEVSKENIDAFMTKREFKAINVTIPYKQTVIPYLDSISESARSIGAVNTIVNKDGKLFGYNTDYNGLKELAEYAGIDLNGKIVAILGTGGTSKTAMAVAKDMGAREVFKVSRTSEETYSYKQLKERAADVEIIINTTPVGMYPKDEGLPVDVDDFPNLIGVLDAIYHPLRSNLVTNAKNKGIKAAGGLYMLCAQAVYASAIFLGKDVEVEKIKSSHEYVLGLKENIVLVGMPSSGKSTVGAILSEKMGREFVDSDEEIKKRIGNIAEYINTKGEPAFRLVEKEVINELSKLDGHVIATGGGAVLDNENVMALKRNGKVFFINRPLDQLETTADRPLSSDREKLQKLYDIRLPIYRESADKEIAVTGDAQSVAKAILGEQN